MDPVRDEISERTGEPLDAIARQPTTRVPLCTFCALAAGVLLAHHWHAIPSSLWYGLAGSAVALALITSGRVCKGALLLAVVLTGAGWMTARCYETPRDSIARWVPRDALFTTGELLTVEGVVFDDPVTFEPTRDPMAPVWRGRSSSRFDLRVGGVVLADGSTRPVSGRLRVRVASDEVGVRSGDIVRVMGMARPTMPPMNPGEPDARLYASERNEGGTLRLDRPELITTLDPRERPLLERAFAGALRWRAVLTRRAARAIGDDDQSLLPALILGERDRSNESVRTLFQRQGLAHLLAISGFHLAVMAGFAWFVLQLTGERPRLHALIVMLLVVVYLVVVPARPPILRAGFMVLALLGGELFGRRYDRLGVLAWAATLLVLWRPMTLWDLGFQLSFGLTAVLLTLAGPFLSRCFGPEIRGLIRPRRTIAQRARRAVLSVLLISVLCWSVAVPTVMYRIGIVSTLAPLTTVVVLPIVVVLLWSGYALLVVGAVVPSATGVVQPALDAIGQGAVRVTSLADALPWSVLHTPPVSLAWTVCATGAILLWFVRGRLRDPLSLACVALAIAWFAVEAHTGSRPDRGVLIRIDTLNVGDGTCHLIRSGDDAMLWDAGSLTPGLGRRVLPRAVRSLGVHRVPLAVLSHPNIDHYNALPDMAPQLGLRRVLLHGAFDDLAHERSSGGEAFLLEALQREGVAIERIEGGHEFVFGHARVTFLSPARFNRFEEVNDLSLVARFVVTSDDGARTLLMTGDIQREAMRSLLDSPVSVRAEVLEMPHHGSVTDSAMEFLLRVDPAVVLQSTGPSRALHPAWRGQQRARAWHATAVHGWSWAEILRDGSVRSGAMHD